MSTQDWNEVAEKLGTLFGERAAAYDADDRFVADNYRDLKEHKVLSMLVPEDLGGGGATYRELCDFLRHIGRHCASTALALSMHQHLVAATVFRHKKGMPGAKMLEKVGKNQIVLVSTGATDWIRSNGSARPVEGGYRVSGRKIFGSGGPAGDVLMTSFPAPDEPEGPSVIHCAVPIASDGVKRLDDWHTIGMRGTGSHSFVLEDVFVPADAVALKRPQNEWHPAWDVVCGIALPIVMACYVGLAEAAYDLALTHAKKKADSTPVQIAVGKMQNALTTAQIAWEDTLRMSGNCDFTPSLDNSNAQIVRKVIITNAVKETVERAIDAVGGSAFYRSLPMERLWRDVQASHYHPLPESRQLLFSGRQKLGRPDFWDV